MSDKSVSDKSVSRGNEKTRSQPHLPGRRIWTAPSESEARTAADIAIREFVRQGGPTSRQATDLEDNLFDIGRGTLRKWNSKDLLFPRLARMRIFLPTPPAEYREESVTLIWVSVTSAIPVFMNDFVFGDKWEPGKASLNTCFLNGCLICFGREYRRYYSEERPGGRVHLELEVDVEPDERSRLSCRPAPDPLDVVVGRDELERAVAIGFTPDEMMMFFRASYGFTQAEIAQELGLTESAVNSSMRRNRRKIAEHRRQHGTDGEPL